ncbi:hypothetical protein [Burkholderia singularis]|uniref:hypothetical protein n=1 Tax=Burkholderia singularis TaxID=1503053 RepID=UPI000AFB100C|nr:hypothetical protein [Burkholderia singularis]
MSDLNRDIQTIPIPPDLPSYQYNIFASNNQNYWISSSDGANIGVSSINLVGSNANWFFIPITALQGQYFIFLDDGNFSINSSTNVVQSGTFINYNPQNYSLSLELYPKSPKAYPWLAENPGSGIPYNFGAPKGRSATICIATQEKHLLLPTAYVNNAYASNLSGGLSVDIQDTFLYTDVTTQWFLKGSGTFASGQ